MPIRYQDVSYIYSKKTPFSYAALKNINLEIEDGDFLALVGKTGCGKTTLVQQMNGLLFPTSGTVYIDNFVVKPKHNKIKQLKPLRKHVGLVFQFPEYQLFEETVLKDVAFGVKNFGASKEESLKKARESLLSVGIPESYFERSPLELSGGERRRVAIAGILAIHPDILVLDEPTAGLDPKSAEEVMSLVKKMHEEGTTIIVVTHDMDLVVKYVQKVFVMHQGKLIFEGTPNKLFSHINEEMSIEIPSIYILANKLAQKGVTLDIEKIKNTDDLVKQVKEWRNHHE